MKKILLGISLNLFIGFLSKGQSLDKSLLYGTWTGKETGVPGRSIKQNDSSYLSHPPVTYSNVTIELKSFGRLVKTTKGYHGIGIHSKLKGKWKISGDTLSLQFRQLDEKYLIDQSIEERIFFKSLNSGSYVYGRKE